MKSGLLENLNKEQAEAVTHGDRPLLIVAGAGTGKTTVITRRIAHLVEQKLAKPEEILALTFTEKAAGEMQERVDLLMPLGYHDMWISTFHSFCQRILEQHGLDIGLPGNFKLVNEARAWILVHNNLEKFNLDYYRPLGNPAKFISALLKHFSRCKDELITPEQYLEYAQELRLSLDNPEGIISQSKKAAARKKLKIKKTGAQAETEKSDPSEIFRLQEIADAFHTYEKLLADNGCLDFANLINYTLKLFQTRPQILNRYQRQFKYIMVDEFQDTNFAQYQLVKLLSGERKNLAVVGDDDQSIYKFRGASVSNILKFKDDYPGLKEITLVENYRSSQNILDLAYNFIQANNPDRLEEKLKIGKRLKSNTSKPGKIEVLEGKDLAEEMDMIAKKIIAEKSGNPRSTWNDFAVLIRSNSSAEELLPALEKYKIPNTFLANTGLYNKQLISLLIAYLRTLDNFHDSFALYRILGFSSFRLPAADLATLMFFSQKRTISLFESMRQAGSLPEIGQKSQAEISKILSLLNSHALLARQKSANEVFVEIVLGLELEKILEEDNPKNVEDRELLEQFYKKIEAFVAENDDKSLHNFLAQLELEIEAGEEGQIKFDPNQGPESLKILTVHSAKGLEFEYVFLPNMVDQRFPTRARGDSIEIPEALVKDILPQGDFHLQEERRLFYVALTRAKTHLCLSWGKDYGGAKTKKPSMFLQETGLVPGGQTSTATGKVIFGKSGKDREIYKQLPQNFSFSALKCFNNCPLEYKYQYYLKLPVPGSSYFSFGQTIHKVFEIYLKDLQKKQSQSQPDLFSKKNGPAQPGDIRELEKLYEQNWVDEWYKDKRQKEDYRKKGLEMLKIFYNNCLTNQPHPKYLEKFFSLPLGDYRFVGKIDRADNSKNGIKIIDYKTGEKPKKTDKNDLDQLYVYQWAAEEYLKEKVESLEYWYLKKDEFKSEKVAVKEEISELKARLLAEVGKIIDAIKFDRFKELHSLAKKHECRFKNLE